MIGKEVHGVKVIVYTDDGQKYIYKFGDPQAGKALLFELDVDQDYDEYDELFSSATIFKPGSAKYTFSIRT